MEATPQHAPAPAMKRGVEVSNKLDPDGTLIKGTRDEPRRRAARLPRILRLSAAPRERLSASREKSSDGARAPAPDPPRPRP